MRTPNQSLPQLGHSHIRALYILGSATQPAALYYQLKSGVQPSLVCKLCSTGYVSCRNQTPPSPLCSLLEICRLGSSPLSASLQPNPYKHNIAWTCAHMQTFWVLIWMCGMWTKNLSNIVWMVLCWSYVHIDKCLAVKWTHWCRVRSRSPNRSSLRRSYKYIWCLNFLGQRNNTTPQSEGRRNL